MKKTLVLLLLAFLCAGLRAADNAIAVIDMKKVFDEYEKTKVVEKKLQEQMDVFKEYSMKLASELQAMKKEFEEARDAAQNNFALTEAERKSKELKARDLYEQMAVKQAEIKNYNQSRQEQIRGTYEKLRSEILGEIKNTVRNQAMLQGWSLVLDQSGSTSNEISAVIYFAPKMDITKSVLDELNRAYKKAAESKPSQTK